MVESHQQQRRAGHGRAEAGARPAGVRHRHHRRGRRIERFLEKPTWGQVFSDTVNTGIYVMEPEVFEHVAAEEAVDWSGDVFPALLAAGAPLYGYVADGYWEDVGTHESYLRAQADVLNRAVDVEIDGFELSPGVWVGEGAEVDPEAVLRGPLYIGDYAKVEAGAELREYTVLGSNVVVKGGAFLHRAVVHDNVFIGPGRPTCAAASSARTPTSCAAPGSRRARSSATSASSRRRRSSPTAVKVYPFKTIEAGAVVNTSVIWESRGHRQPVRAARRVAGWSTSRSRPSSSVRLASAYATTLKKGSRRHDQPRRVAGGARAQARRHQRADRQRDRRTRPRGGADCRSPGSTSASPRPVGGIMLRTTPGDPQSIDIVFLDEQRRRPFPGGAAQARAGLLPRGVPPGVPGRDRRADVPAARDSSSTRRSCCTGIDTTGVARGRRSRSSSTPPAVRRPWCCPRCSAVSASTCSR